MELVEKMLNGDDRSLSRLITLVENDAPEVPEIMSRIYPQSGNSYCIGITGPPGGGKSTLVDKLTAVARKKGLTVGVIAVDPTSPFSGGAVLGDRIRMQQHCLDRGVFIRSMATRGSLGGLPVAAKRVAKLLEAFGKDIILIETVGVGQTELDIIETADTVAVVLYPGGGDTIQTLKAGLMEIADIFVVNKSDREGAEQVAGEIEAMLELRPKDGNWMPSVISTQADKNVMIKELFEDIERHRSMLEDTGQLSLLRKDHLEKEFVTAIEQSIKEQIGHLMENNKHMAVMMERIRQGEIDPYSAAKDILGNKKIIKDWLLGLEK
jgi:LAO/AO transport system kinase